MCEAERERTWGISRQPTGLAHLQWYCSTISPGKKLHYPNLVEALWRVMEGLTSSCQSTPKETPAEPVKNLWRLVLLACPNSTFPEQLRVEKRQRSTGGGNLRSVKRGPRTAGEVLDLTNDPGEFLGEGG